MATEVTKKAAPSAADLDTACDKQSDSHSPAAEDLSGQTPLKSVAIAIDAKKVAGMVKEVSGRQITALEGQEYLDVFAEDLWTVGVNAIREKLAAHFGPKTRTSGTI
jgi:hypothetical protein